MKVKEIAALPVSEWSSSIGCHLYLWVTNNYLEDAFVVLDAWGFRYVTKIDWFKGDIDDGCEVGDMDDRDLQAGLGQYFRGVTESCLFAVRGKLPYRQTPEGKRAQGRTGFHAPRREHSQKPEKLRQMAGLVSPGPRLEMFAREAAPGWDAWGNQAPDSPASSPVATYVTGDVMRLRLRLAEARAQSQTHYLSYSHPQAKSRGKKPTECGRYVDKDRITGGGITATCPECVRLVT